MRFEAFNVLDFRGSAVFWTPITRITAFWTAGRLNNVSS